jgi:hypothetical protein
MNGIGTVVLDAVKFSGTDTLSRLLAAKPKLVALSLSSCQLNDTDLKPLFMAIKSQELPLTMLKVSANRLSDESLIDMCDSLCGHKTHPLAVLDLSGNNVSYQTTD